jgi:outer membrane protein assembly factor BamB
LAKTAATAPARRATRGVVAAGHAGRVFLIEARSGQVVWERRLADVPGASACDGEPVTVRLVNERVIAAAMGHVFALALADGSLLWHVDRRSRGAGATSLAVERD